MLDYQIVLPDCNKLPVIGMDNNCVRLGMPLATQLIKPHSCFVQNGEDYRGTVSMSKSGRTCQPWHASFNHRFGAHVDTYGLTMLMLDPKHPEGLQVLINSPNGKEWIDVPYIENSIVINIQY